MSRTGSWLPPAVHDYIEAHDLYADAWRKRYGGGLIRPGGRLVENSAELARMAADAIFSKKGMDIVLLEVEGLFVLSDVFVIATGTSRPHVQSLADQVEEKLREEQGLKPLRSEGKAEAEWVLIDFGDIIVHLFQAATTRLLRSWSGSGPMPSGSVGWSRWWPTDERVTRWGEAPNRTPVSRHGAVAQPGRALDWQSRGQGFKSPQLHSPGCSIWPIRKSISSPST